MWSLIITFLFGGSVGFIISKVISRGHPVGTLRIDTSDPDGPYLFLESNIDPHTILHHKHVMLNVDVKNYISH